MSDIRDTVPDPVAGHPVTTHDVDLEKTSNFYTAEKDDAEDTDIPDIDSLDDIERLKRTEALEARLDSDRATESDYRIENAHDVAIKVLSTQDDPELPCLTFRMLFLGFGFSAFGYACIRHFAAYR